VNAVSAFIPTGAVLIVAWVIVLTVVIPRAIAANDRWHEGQR